MGEDSEDMSLAEEIRYSCKKTLSGLKTTYLDLYLLPADSHRKMLKVGACMQSRACMILLSVQ